MSEAPQEPGSPSPEPPIAASAAPSELGHAQQQAVAFYRMMRELTPRVFVTHVLIAMNLIVFGLGVASGVSGMNPTVDDLLKWGANHGPKVVGGEWWRTLTSMFLHIGIIHIAMNMFILGSVGPLVERLVGNVGFLILYVVAGLGGSMASLCYNPLAVSAGASGAVFGVFGALLAVLRQKSGTMPKETLASIRKSGLAFVGYNLVFGFMLPGIDNAAHVGGLVAGFLCGVVLNLPLAPESLAKRPARNVIAVVGGLALVVVGAGAVLALYSDLADAMAELDRAPSMEKRIGDTYTTARARAERDELSLTAYAEVIEHDVLPEWRAAADRLASMHNIPAEVRAHNIAVVNYMRLRQQAWELEAQAARAGDREMMRLADQAHDRASEAAGKLNPPGK